MQKPFVLTSLILSLVLFTSTAFGLSLDQAKTQGLVGETPSGYLEAVKTPPSTDVKALVADINSKRKAHYENISKKNGTTLVAVEILAGKKAIEKTEPGNYIKTASGSWKKK